MSMRPSLRSPRPHLAVARCILALTCASTSLAAAAAESAAPVSFFDMQDRGLIVGLAHFVPRDDFGDSFRNIDITLLDAAVGWRLSGGLEVRALASALVARGERAEPFDPAPPRGSEAEGIAVGGALRYNLALTDSVDLFAEGAIQFLWTAGTPFPVGGTGVNGLTRWGGGISVDITPGFTLEASYLRSHVSNGGGIVDWNPAWNGHGIAIGVRQRF